MMTLIQPSPDHTYPVVSWAGGALIRDTAGREWIDGSSGAIACSIGHCHPHVSKAVGRQMETVSFVYRTQFASESAQRLAKRICAKLGYAAAFFVNSGSEAVESAVRFAQQFWREAGHPAKMRILSRKISYHGSTAGTLALSGHWPRRRAMPTLAGEPSLPTPYCYRCPFGKQIGNCGLACARAVEQEVLRLGADNIAAILVEPVVGASGAAIVSPPGYLKALREICDRYDVLLIGDEVLTGLGRTGRWLGMEHGKVEADIVCLGKGLNAGYFPVSGVLINARIRDLLQARRASISLGHTHSNHPVGAAAANAVLDVLEEENLVARAAIVGADLGDKLRGAVADRPFVGEVRGTGMLWGLELVRDDGTCEPWPAVLRAADAVVRRAFELGLVVYPSSGFISGIAGDAIIIAPPFNTPQALLDSLVERLADALDRAVHDLHHRSTGDHHVDYAA